MKKFVKKTILFILFPLAFYLSLFEFLKFKLHNNISESDAIIVGDSHTEFLNIPNVYNYSIPASPYILQYNFLQSIKDELKGKSVFISFGYHNISPLYENRFNNNVIIPSWISMVNREINSVSFIPKRYHYNWQSNIKESIFSRSRLVSLFDCAYKTDFINSVDVCTDTTFFAKTVENHYADSRYLNVDIIQEKYLTSIIELLVKQDCHIFLLNTPVTEYYLDNIPTDIKEKHNYLANKFKETQYLDFNEILDLEIDSTMFKDADHFNQKGDSLIVKYLTHNILKTNARTHNNVHAK